MKKYINTAAGRIQLIQFLGRFAVVGGTIVTTLLLSATFL